MADTEHIFTRVNADDIKTECLAELFVDFSEHLVWLYYFDPPDFVAKDGLSQTIHGTNTHSRLSARSEINAELIGRFVFQCRPKSLS
jgi:hypothetical protein